MSHKLMPGNGMPLISLSLLSGEQFSPGKRRDHWELFVIYRGIHCPRCKTYLNKLEKLKSALEAIDVAFVVASADSRENAQKDANEHGWTMPVAYGFSLTDIQSLGLYASRHPDGQFYAEPGLFVLNPEMKIQIIGVGNAASCRPDLDVLLDGIKGIQSRNLPITGTAVTE